MRAILQRVTSARVEVDQQTVGEISKGWLVLLGVTAADTSKDVSYLANKIAGLRAFNDADGKMNLDVREIEGSVLVVSQFTLYGDCRKGRRPSFVAAAPPQQADALYQELCNELRDLGLTVATGQFQASMQVSLVNDGPVTMMLDSQKEF